MHVVKIKGGRGLLLHITEVLTGDLQQRGRSAAHCQYLYWYGGFSGVLQVPSGAPRPKCITGDRCSTRYVLPPTGQYLYWYGAFRGVASPVGSAEAAVVAVGGPVSTHLTYPS